METARPRLHIIPSKFDIIIDRISLCLLLFTWGFALFNYLRLPDTIPIHYNFKGDVDGYGNKVTLWIMPVIITILFLLLTYLNNYPHIFNYLNKITEENALQEYTFATRTLRYLKLILVGVICIISILIDIDPYSKHSSAVNFILPVIIITTFLPVVVASYFLRKIKN